MSSNLNKLRMERDLTRFIWVAIKKLKITSTSILQVAIYRQELRDITNTYQSMDDEGFAFPTKPTDTE